MEKKLSNLDGGIYTEAEIAQAMTFLQAQRSVTAGQIINVAFLNSAPDYHTSSLAAFWAAYFPQISTEASPELAGWTTYIANEFEEAKKTLSGFQPIPAEPALREAIFAGAVEAWEGMANVNFVLVEDPALADVRIGISANDSINFAPGSLPGMAKLGDVYLNKTVASTGLTGDRALLAVFHELGHVLGLWHPTASKNGLLQNEEYDQQQYTVLSHGAVLTSFRPATPMLFDALGLEKMGLLRAGINSESNTKHQIDTVGTGKLIIDNGGSDDVIDASSTATDNEIDLRATDFATGKAYFSSIGMSSVAKYNVAIYRGSQIENAKGGSGSDRLIGNDLSNTLEGGAGNDILIGSKGNDTLKGGAGNDSYRFKTGDGSATIADNEGVNRLYVEDKLVRTFGFRKAAGEPYKLPDGGMLQFNSPGVLTLSNGLQLTFQEQSTPEALEQDFGFHLFEEAPTPSSYDRTILGDLAPVDQSPSTPGVQTAKNELDNVIVNPDQPEADRVDVLYDSTGNDDIRAKGGDDFIDAFRGGSDRIDAGTGNDIVLGGEGDDIVVGGAGSDILHGQEGRDRLYGGEQVTIEDALAAQDGTPTGLKGEFLTGGSGEDIIVGDAGNDLLIGGGGDDLVLGGPGNDDILPDVIVTGVGWDWSVTRSVTTAANGGTIYSYTLNDVGTSGPSPSSGDDVVFAGGGVDWVSTGIGNDYVDAGSGDDVVFAHHGSDEVYGGSGNDVLVGDSQAVATAFHGNDYLDGEDGDDGLWGDGGDDVLIGGAGNDRLVGDLGADGAGSDYLDGGEGNDNLAGGAKDDRLFGGAGNDVMQGDSGTGSSDGNDFLDGGAGNDTLFGEGGDDSLNGGEGADYLLGGQGNDVVAGGGGDDVYFYSMGEGIDRFSDSGGTDWLVFSDILANQLSLGVGSMKLTVPGGEIHLEEFDPDNPLAPGGIEYFQFADNTVLTKAQLINLLGFTPTGTPGPDELSGTALVDTIRGLAGDDVIDARAGNDTIFADEGADRVSGGDGNDIINGGADNDVLAGDGGNDTINGDDGNDTLAGGPGSDTLFGGAGDDTYLFGAGDGSDTATDSLGQNGVWLAGLALGSVRFGRQGNDLIVAVKNTTDRLTVKDWFAVDSHFNTVTLGDGTVLDHAGVEANMPTNQSPAAALDTALVTEDSALAASGNALSNDSDPEGRPLRVTNPGSYTGAYGSLSLQSDGSYTYNLANGSAAVQGLAAGATVEDTFTYTVTDDEPAGAATAQGLIQVTVRGSNDLPLLGADTAATAEDATAIGGNVLLNDADVDAGTTLVISNPGTRAGTYGALSLNQDGVWSYSLANTSAAVQGLAVGQTVTDNFAFLVGDGIAQLNGGLTITISGRNDAPVLATPLADQGSSPNTSWQWQVPAGSFIDVDSGDLLTYGATRADGTALPSWLTFNASTQTFSGRVPKDATGAIDIRVSVTDRAGTTASDVFTLSFSGSTGGGGHGGGNGGGSKGNEGVGNGVDGPPPGHDDSFNDGPGTGPGHPGAQGGNGNPLAPGVGNRVPLPTAIPDEGPILNVVHGESGAGLDGAPGQMKKVTDSLDSTTEAPMADQAMLVGVPQFVPYGMYEIA